MTKNKKNHELRAKVSEEEYKQVSSKAKFAQMKISQFIRYVCLNVDLEISVKGGLKK
jgi:hypothetical protein